LYKLFNCGILYGGYAAYMRSVRFTSTYVRVKRIQKGTYNYEHMRHFRMKVFAHSKMQFNTVRPNVRGMVLWLVSATGGLIWLLVYSASHS